MTNQELIEILSSLDADDQHEVLSKVQGYGSVRYHKDIRREAINAVFQWLSIIEAMKGEYSHDLQKLKIDADHSALLERIIAKEKVYDTPPPIAFSYPNYSLMDNNYNYPIDVHFNVASLDDIYKAKLVIIDQTPWKIVEEPEPDTYLLQYRIRTGKDTIRWSDSIWKLTKLAEPISEFRQWKLERANNDDDKPGNTE